jgi:hypothetical protein
VFIVVIVAYPENNNEITRAEVDEGRDEEW